MTRRTSLRTRLLVALVLTAVGVLTLSAGLTLFLVRATSRQAAIDDLQTKATEIVRQAADLRVLQRQAALRGTTSSQPTSLGQLLVTVRRLLRIADARIVFVAPDGRVLQASDLGPRIQAIGTAGGVDVYSLPAGLSTADLDGRALLAGRTLTGGSRSLVFLARPLGDATRLGDDTAVLVLTQDVTTNTAGRAGPFFLVAAAAALLVVVAVSIWLARRLTRPLAAIESTARTIADGDLSARVEVPPHTEDELAELAGTLNAMAQRLEDAQGAERAFLLSVSHDLRTPLTSIRGYAEAIADGTIADDDPESRARAAAVIGAEARRLERLVRDLLDLARLDTHQFSLRPRAVDAAAVVRDAAQAFGPAAADLGIALDVSTVPAAAPVTLDPERLGQVVANLVENALKYAAGKVVVTLRTAPGGVVVEVADDGPGIPLDELTRVFERLYVARGTPGRSVGTGLGLAIVHELAAAMGGSARAERADGGGARFVVTLPATPVPAPA